VADISNFTVVCRVPDDECARKRDAVKKIVADIIDYVEQMGTTAKSIVESSDPDVMRAKADYIGTLVTRVHKIMMSHELRGRGLV
jgi:hypothetical protein